MASPTDVALCRVPLSELGYTDRGDQGGDGGWLFAKKREPDVSIVHLHIVTIDDPQWRRYLHFRDRLREDPVLRRDYEQLKTALRFQYPSDRPAYTAGKHDFIRNLLNCGEDR